MPNRTYRGRNWPMNLHRWSGPKGKAQVPSELRRHGGLTSVELPEPVLRLAQDEYDRQYPGQPYERMQQRGGLSLYEIIGFLADSLERHGVLPSNEGEKGDVTE